MHHHSRIPMLRLLSRFPFRQSPIPISSFPPKPPTTISSPIISHPISPPKPPNPPQFPRPIHHYSTESEPSIDHSKEIDEINLKFAEAREEIEMALESKETVYFDEEAECAREAVKAVLDMFEGLLGKMGERERAALQRSMGLKIEQLKAELQQLNE
ncbi:hypothetical protein Sjap_018620 [Stephania japonica]|uniref:Late embryogenesis abundant protein n=1 Tax=Stephania japonica TaxID=461633 RepID=A0AAP0NLR1_9MAGN